MGNEITISGDGLGVLIVCEHKPLHHWLAFASWYSIRKHLPDADIAITCEKDEWKGLFGWAYKSKVPFMFHTRDTDTMLIAEAKLPQSKERLVISSYIMAVREYAAESVGPISAKLDQTATFVSCQDGCGRFVPAIWENKMQAPFRRAVDLLNTENITVNEMKVLQIWQDCYTLYSMMQ